MVVKPSKHFQGQIFSVGRNGVNHNHRCLDDMYGDTWTTRLSRKLGQDQENVTYQLSRDGSCIFNFETFLVSRSEQNSFDQIQQYNCGAIYQLTRGTKSPRLCNQTWDLWNWAIDYKVFWKQLLLQENEYSSRLFEQIQDSTNRMDVEHISRSEIFSGYGTSSDRHVCIHSQSSKIFLHMVSTALSMCTRCSVCQLEGNVLECLSSHLCH